MTATELQDALLSALESIADAREEIESPSDEDDPADVDCVLADIARDLADDLGEVKSVRTYKREMMLTTDAGLVVRTADGAEFQITIVQSRPGTGAAEAGDESDDE